MPAVPFCLLFLASSSWIIIIMAHSSSNHLFFSLLSISYLLAGQCSLILFIKMLMLPCYQSLLHQHHHPCLYLLLRHEPINLLQHSWQDAATSQSLCLNSSEPHFLCKPLNIKKIHVLYLLLTSTILCHLHLLVPNPVKDVSFADIQENDFFLTSLLISVFLLDGFSSILFCSVSILLYKPHFYICILFYMFRKITKAY